MKKVLFIAAMLTSQFVLASTVKCDVSDTRFSNGGFQSNRKSTVLIELTASGAPSNSLTSVANSDIKVHANLGVDSFGSKFFNGEIWTESGLLAYSFTSPDKHLLFGGKTGDRMVEVLCRQEK